MANDIKNTSAELGTTATETHGIAQTSLLDNKLNFSISGRLSNYNLTQQNPTYISFGNKVFQSTKVEEALDFDEEVEFNLQFYDFNTKLSYQITPQLNLSVAHLKSNNNFKYNFGLEDEGIEIMTAENGAEALSIIQSEEPELVFLDVMMPKMNGMEVCRNVKQELALDQVYIILLTAKGQEVDRQKGLDMGADRYMTKPFDPDEMLTIAKDILKVA